MKKMLTTLLAGTSSQNFSFFNKRNKGFTLIEILIVVAIIAILAGSVLIGFGPAQRQGRDARRIYDLRQIQNALELYYSKCGYYPGIAQSGNPCGAFQQVSSWSDLTGALKGSNIGTNQIPNDPSSGKTYIYRTDSNGTSYILGAVLEDTNNSALQSSARGNIFGVDCTSNTYCIQF